MEAGAVTQHEGREAFRDVGIVGLKAVEALEMPRPATWAGRPGSTPGFAPGVEPLRKPFAMGHLEGRGEAGEKRGVRMLFPPRSTFSLLRTSSCWKVQRRTDVSRPRPSEAVISH